MPAAPAAVSNRRSWRDCGAGCSPSRPPRCRSRCRRRGTVLSRVHWVRPELVADVKYLTWTADNLPRQVVHEGLRQDKPAAEVRREMPYPSPELSTIDTLTRAQSRKG